jgi:oxalate---CoA ligase
VKTVNHSEPVSPETADSSGPLTLMQLIELRAGTSPRTSYLEDARSERTVDYGTLLVSALEWRDALHSSRRGLDPSVILDISDPISFAVAYVSIIANGFRVIPVDPTAKWAEFERLAARVGTVTAAVSDRSEPVTLDGAIILAIDSLTGGPVISGRQGHAPDAADSIAASSTPERLGGTGSVILFTSGSTGHPKGVEMPEEQLLFVARGIAANNELTASDRGYNPLPLFHVNAEVVGLLSTLVAGASLVLDRRFHRTDFWELLAERRITWVNAVPAILAVLAHSEPISPPTTVRFIRTASAPLPDAVRNAFVTVPLVISWGMTEGASQITATTLSGESPSGSVGVPVGSEVQVRSDDGRTTLPSDSIGALWIRGAGIVKSYFQGASSDRFDSGGWLSTGDLGKVDAQGNVCLIGRSDDVINRGGEKVYPQEVEDVLLEDERVREAIVVARPDPILGQVPVAYVIPPEPNIDDDALRTLAVQLMERCAESLPRFKRPVEVNVVSDVPRAATGKIQRSRLREIAAAALSPS